MLNKCLLNKWKARCEMYVVVKTWALFGAARWKPRVLMKESVFQRGEMNFSCSHTIN